jgi:hypothetical protein
VSEFHFRVRAKNADSGEGSTRRQVGVRVSYRAGIFTGWVLRDTSSGPRRLTCRSRMGFLSPIATHSHADERASADVPD